MKMKLTDLNHEETVLKSSQTIRDGGVVLLPFDTVYGFACDPTNDKALEKIFKLKNRPLDQTIGLATNRLEGLLKITDLDQKRIKYIKNNTPGKYTFIVKLKNNIFSGYCTKEGSAAIRIPDSNLILDICSQIGFVAQTSANKSGQPNCFSISDIQNKLSQKELDTIDLIIDGGLINESKASKIIDLTKDIFNIVRE